MYSTRMRMTGSSGMDIDSIVSDLMKAESIRLNKTKKETILLSWRQEAYRNTAKTLNAFKSTYLDSLSSKNMLSKSAYKNFTSTVKTSGGATSNAVSVTTNSYAAAGEYKVKVLQTASAASVRGTQKTVSSTTATSGEDLLKAVKDANAKKNDPIIVYEKVPVLEDGKQVLGEDGKPLYELVEAKDEHGNVMLDDDQKPIMVPKLEPREVGKEKGFIFSVTYDGVTKDIDLSELTTAELANKESLVAAINVKLEETFGTEYTDKATAKDIAEKNPDPALIKAKMSMSLDANGGITFEGSNRTYSVSGLSAAGIATGASNTADTSEKVSSIIGSGITEVSINNETIEITADMTVKSFMDAINNSEAGVKVSFDGLSKCFNMETKATGEQTSITFDDADTETAMSKVFSMDMSSYKKGNDAILQVNGRNIQSSTNTVKLDSDGGIILNLKDTTISKNDENGEIKEINELTITVTKDNDKLLENIKGFVDAYNELLSKLQTDLKTARPKSDSYSYYEPLLDEEKEGLSDDEIRKMEEKGKTGLLRNDSILSSIVTGFRSAMNASIDLGDGRKLSLYEIGISTSKDTTKGGILEIDEAKLKKAIEERGDDIALLFSGSGSGENKINGVTNLVLKEIENATHTSKGTITKKAGIENYSSATDNYFYNILKDKNARIDTMISALAKKEDAYYRKFSAMEQAMNKSQNQVSAMMSQLGM